MNITDRKIREVLRAVKRYEKMYFIKRIGLNQYGVFKTVNKEKVYQGSLYECRQNRKERILFEYNIRAAQNPDCVLIEYTGGNFLAAVKAAVKTMENYLKKNADEQLTLFDD